MNKTILEIGDQYNALGKTLACVDNCWSEDLLTGAEQFRHMIILGCGSSYSVAKSVAATARILFPDRSICAIPGGDFMLHMEDTYASLMSDTVLIGLSRSGSTDEINMAIEGARKKYPKTFVLSFIEREGTTMQAISDVTLAFPWAFDESVCQTRSVTNLAGGALRLLGRWARDEKLCTSLDAVAEGGNAYLSEIDAEIDKIVKLGWENACVLADGTAYGLAEEGALAFNEIAYVPSVCRHVLDVRHGPIVLLNEKTIVLAMLSETGYSYESAVLNDIAKRGAHIVAYSDQKMTVPPAADFSISFGKKLTGATAALPFLAVAQLVSYKKAIAKGVNPDQPNGLDPWITLS